MIFKCITFNTIIAYIFQLLIQAFNLDIVYLPIDNIRNIAGKMKIEITLSVHLEL